MFAVSRNKSEEVIKAAPDIFLLAGVGATHVRKQKSTTDPSPHDVEPPRRWVAPRPSTEALLDSKVWPPNGNKHRGIPHAESKVPRERPNDSVITQVRPNNNLPKACQQPIVELHVRKLDNMKSGKGNIGFSSIDVCASSVVSRHEEEHRRGDEDEVGWPGRGDAKKVRKAVVKFFSRKVVQMPPPQTRK